MTGGDTIAALATPPGTGAVCLLRLSGPAAVAVADAVFRGRRPLADSPARVLVRGRAVDAAGQAIDDVLAVRFPAPASYTGEDVVELSGHGGPLVARRLLDALLAAGARAAGPGEFTERAFLCGKLDLAQAEAVMDLISARTDLALRAAQAQLAGALGHRIHDLRENLLGTLAHVEAFIDFPEEGIDPAAGAALQQQVVALASAIGPLLETAEEGRILREGMRLVIAGRPNAGKSSLLNVLLGFERAIVSPEAGTTRDTVEEVVNLAGYPVRLIDTAGLREAGNDLERLGVGRTGDALARADMVVEVIDATADPAATARIPVPEAVPHHLVVLNKCDLAIDPGWQAVQAIRLSCRTRAGLDDLVAAVRAELSLGRTAAGTELIAINARHQACLEATRRHLMDADSLLGSGQPAELVAEELRAALDALGDITGKADAEEVLGAIFGRFCIGK